MQLAAADAAAPQAAADSDQLLQLWQSLFLLRVLLLTIVDISPFQVLLHGNQCVDLPYAVKVI